MTTRSFEGFRLAREAADAADVDSFVYAGSRYKRHYTSRGGLKTWMRVGKKKSLGKKKSPGKK